MTLQIVVPGIFTAPGLPDLDIKGFTDTFDRPDSTDIGYTEKPARRWQTDAGSSDTVTGVRNNEGYAAQTKLSGHCLVFADARLSDGQLTVTMGNTAAAAQHGAIFRAASINDYWRLVNAQNVEYRLQKFIGGSVTVMGTGSTKPAPGDKLRIVLDGPTITCYINGVQQMQVTDSHNQNLTTHGFYNNNDTTNTIRDISFTP